MTEPPIFSEAGTPHVQFFTRRGVEGVRWRLLSGNNREIGRGSGQHADLPAAREAVGAVVASREQLQVRLSRAAKGWEWRLLLDGVPVVTSVHAIDRRGRCLAAAERFVELLSNAKVPTALTGWSTSAAPQPATGLPEPRRDSRPPQVSESAETAPLPRQPHAQPQPRGSLTFDLSARRVVWP